MLKWLSNSRPRTISDAGSSVSSGGISTSGTTVGGPPWDHAGYVVLKGKKVWLELYGQKLAVCKEPDGKPREVMNLAKAVITEEKNQKGMHLCGVGFFSKKITCDDEEPVKMWLHQFQLNGIVVKRRKNTPSDETENISFDWVMIEKELIPNKTATSSMADYQILDPIGTGGFGKVMKVSDRKTNNLYAMKIIQKEHATTIEKAVLQSIRHPFIVGLHSVFETRTKLCLVMDLLEGGELFHHIKSGAGFPEHRARFYAAELALALTFLHGEGFIYRDLKPENCLLDSTGHVVLADFGLAKKIDPYSTTSTFCGTPAYIAPEVLQGKGCTKAVDWWGWGCLLYILLTGSPLFSGTHNTRVYDAILNSEPRYPVEVSGVAKDLLSSVLEKEPQKRLSDGCVVKKHPFFAEIEWTDLFHKRTPPPSYDSAVSASALQPDSSSADLFFTEFSGKFSSPILHPNTSEEACSPMAGDFRSEF
eukprot:TRINITY_DN10265_c0_g1_i1.p1 TRINITY_DN10265_c0_g1~~TRINITY_DN10265_c0_g1_i1.p1  ORF type:complete len:476 (+),score=52.72 TRINITY_DN10265_c0_g1_i1:67-1494(+)